MHLDPVIEVQNQQPDSTLRVERLLREVRGPLPGGASFSSFLAGWKSRT